MKGKYVDRKVISASPQAIAKAIQETEIKEKRDKIQNEIDLLPEQKKEKVQQAVDQLINEMEGDKIPTDKQIEKKLQNIEGINPEIIENI